MTTPASTANTPNLQHFFQPLPVQKEIPVWVGGESGRRLRARRLGDAWYPIGTNPRNRLDTLGVSMSSGPSCAAWRRPPAAMSTT
jgi:alkanesulfonate monooxygenase SsuD/methylene tetrahydromethanopterin reductase-like flavin-dependent oxidoreductase (luciferase family)